MVEAGTAAGILLLAGILLAAGIPLAGGIPLAVVAIPGALTFLPGMWANPMEALSVTLSAAISAGAHTSRTTTPRHTHGHTLSHPILSPTALSIITSWITILLLITDQLPIITVLAFFPLTDPTTLSGLIATIPITATRFRQITIPITATTSATAFIRVQRIGATLRMLPG